MTIATTGVGSKRRCAAGLVLSGLLLAGCFDRSAEQNVADAKEALAKDDSAAAVIQLKNALQTNPALGGARVLLGQALLQTGDARGALIELGKAKEMGVQDEQLNSLVAQAMLGQGEFDKVIAEFGAAQPTTKAAQADLWASLAVAYSATGKAAKALEIGSAAVAADASNVRAQLIHVRLLSAASGSAEGLVAVEAVLARFPRNADAWQSKGDLLAIQGKSDSAMDAYRKAIALNKAHVLAHVGSFHLLLGKKDLDGAKAAIDALRNVRVAANQVRLMSTLLALERNDLEAARDSIQSLMKVASTDVRVLHLAGVVAYRRGALLEAQEHLNKILLKDPGFEQSRILLAQANLRSGDPGKALTVLQPLLSDSSGNASAMSIAAEAYLQAGEPRRAEEAFARISKLKPDDVPSRVALALVEIGKGRVEQGMATLKALSAVDSGTAADFALVSALIQRKDWDQALKSLDTLERKAKDNAGPFNLRGRIELARGNQEKAIQAFEAALKRDPAYFPAAASLAALDAASKKFDVALERMQKVLAVDPRSLAANMAVIALREERGDSVEELVGAIEKLIKQMPGEARPRLALIELQLRRQQVKAALSTATEAAASIPSDPGVLRHLAGAQAMSGDYNQAVSTYNKLIALQPSSPEPLMLLAQVYAARGDKIASKQATERALKLKPGYQPAQRALIARELSAGNFAEAHRLAEAMKTLYPNDPLVLSITGDVAVVRKDWNTAVSNYRAVLKLLPQVDVATKLHRVLISSGKLSEAKQLEMDWLAAHPKDLKFLIYSADAALMLSNHVLARERYTAVLQLKPDNANALNNLAWLLNRSKDPKALEYAEKATRLAPQNADYMDTLSQILATAGHFDKAIEVQKKAVDIAPDHAMRRFHLAEFYAGAGHKVLAREQLQRLAALGDGFSGHADVKKLLQAL